MSFDLGKSDEKSMKNLSAHIYMNLSISPTSKAPNKPGGPADVAAVAVAVVAFVDVDVGTADDCADDCEGTDEDGINCCCCCCCCWTCICWFIEGSEEFG